MPEKFMFDRRPPLPLCNKRIDIIVGEPIEFDLPKMRQLAISQTRSESSHINGWHATSPDAWDEVAKRRLYALISEQIRWSMERLRNFRNSIHRS